MMSHELVFVHAPELERLRYPPDCPFKTERISRTRDRLLALGLLRGPGRSEVQARPAVRPELERFHLPGYLDELERAAAGELTLAGLHMGLGGPDTPVFPAMFEYGAWASGAALEGAARICRGEADVVFSLAGGFHHAHADRASGFCYLNDVVLTCMHFADAGRRVACLDVDAHHGDGTQAAFYRRNDVLTISLHESGHTLYPGGGFETERGEGPGLGYNVNVPLPAGTYDEAYLAAFDGIVPSFLRAFDPDVLILELGMDALAGDPLTHLALTNNALVEVILRLRKLDRPILVLGGGGYHVGNTVRGWALAWRTFAEGDADDDPAAAFGGVLLGSTEWAGGLRDPARPPDPEQRAAVEPEIERLIAAFRTKPATCIPFQPQPEPSL